MSGHTNSYTVFIGSLIPERKINEHKTLSFNTADNIAQNTMVDGLHERLGDRLIVITEVSNKRLKYLKLDCGVEARVVQSVSLNRSMYYLSLMYGYTIELLSTLRSIDKDAEVTVLSRGSYIFIAVPILIARLSHKIKWIPFVITTVEVPEYGFPLSVISKMSRWTTNKADGMITYAAGSAHDYMINKPFLEIIYSINCKLAKKYSTYIPVKPNKFTITYTGSFSNAYNFEIIFDAIRETGQAYRWVFAGAGQYQSILESLAMDERYDVDFVGFLNNSEAAETQMSSSLLISLKGGSNKKINRYYDKYAASAKITEYLYTGVPILASDIPSVHERLRPFLSLTTAKSGHELVEEIESIRCDYETKKRIAKCGQEYAQKYLSSKHQNKMILGFLDQF